MNINWDFIRELEGGRQLRGYVPDPEGSGSGVTVATGFDLGQKSVADLFALPKSLQEKLFPYTGLRRHEAVQQLAKYPLRITAQEADLLDSLSFAKTISDLRHHFSRFDHLPDAVQTVLASLAFQYGSPWARCPKFWGRALARDWKGLIAELEDFGDPYTARRRKEAAYLARAMDRGAP